jgi:hypothetical protein
MTWNINLFLPTVIAATPLIEPFEHLNNNLWQASPLLIQPFHYIFGTDFFPKRKSLLISCEPRDCTHSYPLQLTFMDSLITTKHLLHRQDAKSLCTKNQQKDALGHLIAYMAILWAQPCIITDVKTCTSRPRLANAY